MAGHGTQVQLKNKNFAKYNKTGTVKIQAKK